MLNVILINQTSNKRNLSKNKNQFYIVWMNKGVCVFDLDNTLGDFRAIDFFGLLFEPKVLPNLYNMNSTDERYYNSIIKNYDDDMFDFMEKLRNTFEKEIHLKDLDEEVLRPHIKEILNPLIQEFKKDNLEGFIIYSNNANLYSLEYAGRAIEKLFNVKNLFIKYLDRNNRLRDKYDGQRTGSRAKMVNTIKFILPNLKDKNILFMDDLIHNDFYTTPELTYVHVPRYETNIPDSKLDEIYGVFQTIFNSMPEREQEKFFKLFHIKNYIRVNNLEDTKKKYLEYSVGSDNINDFKENLHMINDKIRKFANSLQNSKGGSVSRKRRKSRRTYKRRRLQKYYVDES